jgi:hypothetical protein
MRFLVILLAVALSLPASSRVVTAMAQTEAASIAGTATSSSGETLADVGVQLRDLKTGTVSRTTKSSSTGSFSFPAVDPGNYAVEVLNAAGRVVGTSAAIPVNGGAAVTGVTVRTVSAIASGIARTAGTRMIMAVTSAAAAAGVVGVVSRGQGDASPSR